VARSPRSVWQQRISKWKRSGLTAAEFSRREGLNASTLSWWKWNLARAEATDVDFVELVPSPSVPTPVFEVACPTGHIVRIPSDADAATLQAIFEALPSR
jgi:transposase